MLEIIGRDYGNKKLLSLPYDKCLSPDKNCTVKNDETFKCNKPIRLIVNNLFKK